MTFHIALAFGLVFIGWVAAHNNAVNETAQAQFSPCVVQCNTQVLSRYACTPADSCFCKNSQLSSDLTECLVSCPFSDQLAAIRFQATTCKRPVRDLGSVEALFFALYTLATIFTVARVLSRFRRLGGAGLGWDDYAAIISFVLLTGATACDWYAVDSGGGTDIWGLTVQNVHDFVFWFYLGTVLYIPVLLLTKASLILLYLRIWPFKSSFQSICQVTLGFLCATLVTFQIVAIVQCTPIDFQWGRLKDPTREGHCVNREAWLWSLASIVICFDFIVLLLPIRNLLKLKVPNSRKTGLCAVFLVGLIVIAFSLVRLRYIRGLSNNPNPTRYWSFLGFYSNVEAYLSQVCCCMPTIPGFVRRTYRYVTGNTPDMSSSEIVHGSSQQPMLPIINPDLMLQRDYSKTTDKTFTLSSASMYSAKSGAPAPVIHRQSNPLPHFINPHSQVPSIFMKDYRETGLFHGGSDREQEDLALPPPAIQRR